MAEVDRILERYDLKTLEAAVARRRVREIANIVAGHGELESELRKFAASAVGTVPSRAAKGRGTMAPAARTTRRPNARRLNEISLADAMEQVMRARKNPIHYKDLMQTIQKRGLYRTKSKNLLSTIAVTLKRDTRFKKVEPGLYSLRK